MIWIVQMHAELLRRLPAGFRPRLVTMPALEVQGTGEPDIWVSRSPRASGAGGGAPELADAIAPDESVATVVEPQDAPSLLVLSRDRVVAAVELVSPGNKDRPERRAATAGRYARYLEQGVSLMMIDVHPQPAGFSLIAAIESRLNLVSPGGSAPNAASWRTDTLPRGRDLLLDCWRRPLVVGQPLPRLPLPLTGVGSLLLDLEETYQAATAHLARE